MVSYQLHLLSHIRIRALHTWLIDFSQMVSRFPDLDWVKVGLRVIYMDSSPIIPVSYPVIINRAYPDLDLCRTETLPVDDARSNTSSTSSSASSCRFRLGASGKCLVTNQSRRRLWPVHSGLVTSGKKLNAAITRSTVAQAIVARDTSNTPLIIYWQS